MEIIEKIKSQNLLDFVQKTLGQQGKRELNGIRFNNGHEKTPSLLVYKDNNKGYCDFSGKLGSGTIIDFYMNFYNCDNKTAIKNLKEIFKIESEKKEFIKQPKRVELFTNFKDYQNFDINFLNYFLQKRGFTYEQITLYKENIAKVSKEIGFIESLFIEKGVNKNTLIFPCYDDNFELKGVKLRTTDLTLFNKNQVKSLAINSTGLLYNPEDLNKNQVIICEGEIDYLILKIIGFTSIIGNLGGVQSNVKEIKYLTKDIKEVVSFYDNDIAGQQANQKLIKELGRGIKTIKYPTEDKVDINDLLNRGFYKKEDFEKMIIEEENEEIKEQKLFNSRFFFNDTKLKFFDIKDLSLITQKTFCDYYGFKTADILEMRKQNIIPTYDGICYYDGGKTNMYNLFNKYDLLKPSDNPVIPTIINEFFFNLFNRDIENIKWIMKAIIYKYTHINDVYIPAVIMHGPGGSGKGLFIKLLEQIFNKKNILKGLGQDEINSKFTTYSGQKLVVSFNEVLVDGTKNGKANMSKLKNLIMEEEIFMEKKGQDKIPIENIAWFLLSSNEVKPVQLDGTYSGNRRFTVLKTGPKLSNGKGREIEEAIMDENNIKDFIAYLLKNHKGVEDEKEILPLDNQDKRDLEDLCESVGNSFFKWFEELHPNINKITLTEFKYFLSLYRLEMGEEDFDDRYIIRNFNNGLSIKYLKKKGLSIRGKSPNGYFINKKVDGQGYFESNNYETIYNG